MKKKEPAMHEEEKDKYGNPIRLNIEEYTVVEESYDEIMDFENAVYEKIGYEMPENHDHFLRGMKAAFEFMMGEYDTLDNVLSLWCDEGYDEMRWGHRKTLPSITTLRDRLIRSNKYNFLLESKIRERLKENDDWYSRYEKDSPTMRLHKPHYTHDEIKEQIGDKT